MTSLPLLQNTFVLRRPEVAAFANSIKIVNFLLNQSLRLKKSLKKQKFCIKMISIRLFPDIA